MVVIVDIEGVVPSVSCAGSRIDDVITFEALESPDTVNIEFLMVEDLETLVLWENISKEVSKFVRYLCVL